MKKKQREKDQIGLKGRRVIKKKEEKHCKTKPLNKQTQESQKRKHKNKTPNKMEKQKQNSK